MPEIEHNSVYRQKKIVEILKMLHEGGSFDEAKRIFDSTFSSVDVSEITSAERELIGSGLNPMEIQRLCNVHAAVFKGSINPGSGDSVEEVPGHPVAVIKLENTVITSLLDDELLPVLKKWQQSSNDATPSAQDQSYLQRMKTALSDLLTIDKHYQRKENLIFPIMDRYGITAPPKVMWGVDDDIRGWIKDALRLVNTEPTPPKYDIEAAIEKARKDIEEMIFKEEQILLPMVSEVFTPDDWALIQSESADIGYTLIPEPLPWQPSERDYAEAAKRKPSKMAQELNAMAQSMADEQDLANKQHIAEPESDAAPVIPDDLKAKKDDPAAINALPLHLRAEMGQVQAEQPAKEDARAQINVNISKQPATKKKEMPEFVKQMLADEAAKPASKRRPRITESHLEIGADNHATIVMPTGDLDLNQLTGLFSVLPVDVTFVDANDIVRWFSDNGERIFPRTRAVIGRAVVNCHPPKSMDKVQKILDDFRSGAQDHADFWIDLHGTKKVYIRYFAVHDTKGTYLGCLEVSQDITEIQKLDGEKRL
ncbi:DUF438 domain-containing protein [Loigolactobacillus coryniformis]|uniref:Histidine kinase n=1 Tax=Loigolactobacillus coryniformis subsp. torquens DSM 20004 = KCTC 3535 TaxID=1423822 RepID=A0A2D1KKF4_9LACO|nr:DUF438 domain-containing protein [Loigolactobacillus coryniformis]ATO42584.1 histidine kinase [Loigolactobacillus coryniformis subsp. torquens DSM 20004 = KCTC 3535]KRK85469.1 hypothetical protein FC16_GL001766 [Loigolactobacillus coryniformis subsp. torquens DSM 20004 = KCTC 3535]